MSVMSVKGSGMLKRLGTQEDGRSWKRMSDQAKRDVLRFRIRHRGKALNSHASFRAALKDHLLSRLKTLKEADVENWFQFYPWILSPKSSEKPSGYGGAKLFEEVLQEPKMQQLLVNEYSVGARARPLRRQPMPPKEFPVGARPPGRPPMSPKEGSVGARPRGRPPMPPKEGSVGPRPRGRPPSKLPPGKKLVTKAALKAYDTENSDDSGMKEDADVSGSSFSSSSQGSPVKETNSPIPVIDLASGSGSPPRGDEQGQDNNNNSETSKGPTASPEQEDEIPETEGQTSQQMDDAVVQNRNDAAGENETSSSVSIPLQGVPLRFVGPCLPPSMTIDSGQLNPPVSTSQMETNERSVPIIPVGASSSTGAAPAGVQNDDGDQNGPGSFLERRIPTPDLERLIEYIADHHGTSGLDHDSGALPDTAQAFNNQMQQGSCAQAFNNQMQQGPYAPDAGNNLQIQAVTSREDYPDLYGPGNANVNPGPSNQMNQGPQFWNTPAAGDHPVDPPPFFVPQDRNEPENGNSFTFPMPTPLSTGVDSLDTYDHSYHPRTRMNSAYRQHFRRLREIGETMRALMVLKQDLQTHPRKGEGRNILRNYNKIQTRYTKELDDLTRFTGVPSVSPDRNVEMKPANPEELITLE